MTAGSAPVSIGRYQIIREVGRGGCAVVYEALDTHLNRTVALKVLTGDDPRMIDRLRREAASLAKLRHPNIVPVHDVGEVDGSHFIAMDFIRGSTLADALPRMVLRKRIEILEPVARAAHFAHEHGIVHRDLKPQNVLIEAESGKPFLSDFGLARDLDSRTLTRSGSALGTPFYMAPEQVRGDRRLIKPTTDVWALGVMLYEAVANRPPFSAQTALEVYDSILRSEPRPLRNTPQDLAIVCFKALEKDPFRRYPSAKSFADDLRRHLNGEPIQARPASLHYRVWKKIRRHPLPVAVAAILFVTSTIAAAVISSSAARERSRARSEANQLLGPLPAERKAALAALIRADHLARTAEDVDLRYSINRKLADLALAGNNYDLARLAFAACEALRPGEKLQPLVDERELAEGRRRKERIEAAIADLNAGLGRTDRPPGAPLLDDYVFEVVQYNDEQTISLLADALAPLAARADKETRWSQEERDLMTFTFRVLGRLDRDSAVAPLALMMGKLWDDALATERGLALCNTRRPAAQTALVAARDRLGINSRTWVQIVRFFGRVPADQQESSPMSAEQYHERGLIRSQKGDLSGALSDFTKSIELDPRDAQGYNSRGWTRHLMEDYPGAIQDLSRAVTLDPRAPYAFANRAATRLALRDHDGAIQDYTKAIEFAPQRADYHDGRGRARIEKGDLDGAIADCTIAIRLDPRLASAFASRAVARLRKEDVDGSIEDFTAAIKLDPKCASAFCDRGNAWGAKGDLHRAMADYNQALELDPRLALALSNRGNCRFHMGDRAGALTDKRKALEVAPADWPCRSQVESELRTLEKRMK